MKTARSLASAHAKPAASSPGLLRRGVAWSGVLLMVAMMSINGLSMGSEDWIGTAATLICGGLLVLSAYRDWAILWNWFGRFLRSLLGEKSARIALGVIGTAFALGGLFGSMTR